MVTSMEDTIEHARYDIQIRFHDIEDRGSAKSGSFFHLTELRRAATKLISVIGQL